MYKVLAISCFFLVSTMCSASDIYSILAKEDPLTMRSENTQVIQHACPRPIKLKEVNDNRDVKRYNEALHKYGDCIRSFQKIYTEKYNKSENIKERSTIAKALERSQEDWISYNTLRDVEQNQELLARFKSLSIGWEEEQKKAE